MPQEELKKLLEEIGLLDLENPRAGVGMDCSIVETSRKGSFLVSTTDFFYPLVEDPYLQGRIACANVLSDLYAFGLQHCDTMLMTLAASRDMQPDVRHVVTKLMMKGFIDLAKEAGTRVTGGQSVLNPWPIIGGVAMACCAEEDIIRPENAQPGHVLVLTKPLGTQVAVNAHQWLRNAQRWEEVHQKTGVTRFEVLRAYEMAGAQMARLNRTGAQLMHKHRASCATDVTGFGIMGHAENLAQNQKRTDLVFNITSLPFIASMLKLDALNPSKPHAFKLAQGRSAETSGGLLVALPSQAAAAEFIAEIKALDKCDAWVVGSVSQALQPQKLSTALLAADLTTLEI